MKKIELVTGYDKICTSGYFGHPMAVAEKAVKNNKSIGEVYKNPNEILHYAASEKVIPAIKDEIKRTVLGIDYQNTFFALTKEFNELGVAGAEIDGENFTKFIYKNIYQITNIALTADEHSIRQVFHSAVFKNKKGEQPAPFTIIRKEDLIENGGDWEFYEGNSKIERMIEVLEELNKPLIIWPYHGLGGSLGEAVESNVMNMTLFHSYVRETEYSIIRKGKDKYSEMYGALEKEYNPDSEINEELYQILRNSDEIYIGGEAKSHCVYETIAQILKNFEKDKIQNKIFVLTDAMSVIPGFEKITQEKYQELEKKGVVMIDSEYRIY